MIEIHLEWGNISWTKPIFAININTDPCIYESRAVLVVCPIVLILFFGNINVLYFRNSKMKNVETRSR